MYNVKLENLLMELDLEILAPTTKKIVIEALNAGVIQPGEIINLSKIGVYSFVMDVLDLKSYRDELDELSNEDLIVLSLSIYDKYIEYENNDDNERENFLINLILENKN